MNSLQYLSTQVDKVIGQDYVRSKSYAKLHDKASIVLEEDEHNERDEQIQHQQTVHDIDNFTDVSSSSSSPSSSTASPPKQGSSTANVSEQNLLQYISVVLNNIVFYLVKYIPLTLWQRATGSSQFLEPSSLSDSDQALVDAEIKSPRYQQQHQQHRHTQSYASSMPYLRLAPPPRPLLKLGKPDRRNMKTLILDLDETLIHSLSRGAKFSQGQMVEVRLQNHFATLYLVNKRPHCDEFLNCVSQWYRLVVFTASVPAYADPMIDWLEKERKYFDARFYRQHCTQSSDGFIKDLTKVEPDLSKVLIIDNSPVSYSLHQENAIGIEGWISDPSDHSLLNILPFLEALRYSTDVRSLLSLKMGAPAVQ